MSGRSEQRERARRGERRAASGARAAQAPGGGRGAGGALTKVVLARRSDVRFRGRLDPLALLATLQARGLTAPLVTHAGPASTHTFKCSACGSQSCLVQRRCAAQRLSGTNVSGASVHALDAVRLSNERGDTSLPCGDARVGSPHPEPHRACAQERDPRAYQAFLQVPGGAAFLACTPEQLFARTGRSVASEAVAATRARGPPGARRAASCFVCTNFCGPHLCTV